jgi:hypothetical protein
MIYRAVLSRWSDEIATETGKEAAGEKDEMSEVSGVSVGVEQTRKKKGDKEGKNKID